MSNVSQDVHHSPIALRELGVGNGSAAVGLFRLYIYRPFIPKTT